MTDEERKNLVAELRYWTYPPYMAEACIKAADEIERLAEELRISSKALSMCSDECNRCYELAERSDARHKKEIERLKNELQVWTGIRA